MPDLEVNAVQLAAHLPISRERFMYCEFQRATATLQALTSIVVRNGCPCYKQELPFSVREY